MTAAALIYVVDDDPLVLTSLRSLLELETSHRVRIFAQAEAALEALRTESPELLVTDLAMPGMDGIELLERAHALRPDTLRIVLTGYADKDSAVRAINAGRVHEFIEKPWDNEHLLVTIGNAVEHVRLARELRITVAELRARNVELERTLAELRAAQDRLIATERLAAVGRLASGIAHEIGNQLSLLGFAELLAERYADDPEAKALTDPLLAVRRRMSSMVASIKEFVRGAGTPSYGRERQRLAPIVEETLSILQFEPTLKLRTLTREPWDESVMVEVNAEKILQVVLNLIRNALQATREGGHIRLGIERVGERARLEVADDGSGIDATHLERIWEPFFSTKGDAGTGLGLGICRRIIEEHGGTIEVRSAPRQGATFTAWLPASP